MPFNKLPFRFRNIYLYTFWIEKKLFDNSRSDRLKFILIDN